VPAESTDPAKTAGRLVIDAGSAPRSPATARWQDRGDLVDEAAVGVGKLHNNTMKLMVGVTEELEGCVVLRPPPMLENRMHATSTFVVVIFNNITFVVVNLLT